MRPYPAFASRWLVLPAAVFLVGCPPEDVPEPGWDIRAPMPEARTEVTVTTDGERVFVAGGFVPPPPDVEDRPPVSRTLLAYDPGTDAWTDEGRVPIGTHHAAFVRVGELLYLIGGYRDNTFDPIGDVWIYDPAAGEWSEGTPMPTPRGALAFTVLDGRVHTIGGTVEDVEALDPDEHSPSAEDASVGTHEVYDPATDSWERLAPMPTPRNHHVAEAVDGRIYVTAGRMGRNFTMTVTEVYDPESGAWTEAASLPTGRSGVAGAALDGWFYVFGGETFDPGEARTFDDAERYDPDRDLWEALAPMPTARHGLGAAVVNGGIFVVSGGPDPGFAFGDANERLVP